MAEAARPKIRVRMNLAYAKHIVNTETQIDPAGIYRAKEEEADPKKCAINRHRRMNALNRIIGNDGDEFIYSNWKAAPKEQYDDEHAVLCLCGHAITKSHIIEYSGEQPLVVAHGSECINKVTKEFPNNPHAGLFVDKYKELVAKFNRTCKCGNKKLVKDDFCGGSVCDTVVHKEWLERNERERQERIAREEADRLAKQALVTPTTTKSRWFNHFDVNSKCLV